MKTHPVLATAIAFAALAVFSPTLVHADAVTDWNAQLEAAQKASGLLGTAQSRSGAIVHAAIFDAVNGIARKYTPYHVTTAAPPGARQEAAAAQAAYTTLLSLYPSRKPALDVQLEASLASIPGHQGDSQSIAAGRAWGDYVAQTILTWRATDGFTDVETYFGTANVGEWRSGLTVVLSGVAVQFSTMVPFTMSSTSQFRPGPPYGSTDRLVALTTAAYAADFNEVKTLGRAIGSTRTPEQTELALFWHAVDVADANRALRSIVPPDAKLIDNARLFALANLACADASIAIFEAKYTYGFWRPFQGIVLAADDNNPATIADAGWTSLITTPRHPEYPSAHCGITGSFLAVASVILGDEHTFTLSTPGFPSATRTYSSFSSAINAIVDARVYIGFHFRASGEEGRDVGYEIARHVVGNFLRPLHSASDQ